ncbi:unnamed protein product [Linum tenue]|uniref:Uncharacterized protein n=1 Tax=Linum tenue TaxID=586396 RepID=A0AAV0KQN8_9ROSI|nr:unnamed protein product [Linum tenue]
MRTQNLSDENPLCHVSISDPWPKHKIAHPFIKRTEPQNGKEEKRTKKEQSKKSNGFSSNVCCRATSSRQRQGTRRQLHLWNQAPCEAFSPELQSQNFQWCGGKVR